MNIWPGIWTMINGKTAITDLIGSDPMRFYPDILPQGQSTFPAVVYSTNVIVSHPTFDGASRIDFNMVDFHAYADTKSEVEDVIDTFRDELEDTSGTFSSLVIKNVRYVDSGGDDWLDDIEKRTKSIEFQITTLR